MDEAYIEFLEDPVDLIPLIRLGARKNLILMRTFSKIYGLAGLRIGYGIGEAGLVSALEKVRQPFNANLLAQTAALAALDDDEHVRKTRANNFTGLGFFSKEAPPVKTRIRCLLRQFHPRACGRRSKNLQRHAKARRYHAPDGRVSPAGVDSYFHRHPRGKRALPGRVEKELSPDLTRREFLALRETCGFPVRLRR